MIVNQADLLKQEPIKEMFGVQRTSNGVSHGMSEAGYDICLKQEVHFYKSACGDWRTSTERPESFAYKHGRFTIASAIEEFDMPNDLVGIVHDKSTWARRGLSVFNTVIEPGWKGFLTLELVYHGNKPLHIPAGSGIAQVVFHKVSCPVRYTGKYQNQENRPVEAIAS